jgi:hypothetical protein
MVVSLTMAVQKRHGFCQYLAVCAVEKKTARIRLGNVNRPDTEGIKRGLEAFGHLHSHALRYPCCHPQWSSASAAVSTRRPMGKL